MIQSFLDGILFFIAVQLLVVAAMHFVERADQKSIFLALVCLVNGLWYFYFIFYQTWKTDWLLGVLIGPDKTVFLPALVYFYLKSIRGRLPSRFIGAHVVFPFIFYVFSLLSHFNTDKNWSAFAADGPSPLIFIALAYFWIYFLKARKELKISLKTSLLPKVYKRVRLFLHAFFLPLLTTPLFDAINALFDPNSQSVYSEVFRYTGDFFYYCGFFVSYLLSLYALTELGFIRRLLFPGNALLSKDLLGKKEQIDKVMDQELIGKKLFRNSKISADSFASDFDLTKKELLEYLKLTGRGSFNECINRLRVDEFKANVRDAQNEHLDLVGLAKDCGFQSKSTFFRVFKEVEGITPNEYKKKVNKP